MKSIDELLNYYEGLMPKKAYLMVNKERYPIIVKAVKEICDMASLCDKEAKVDIHPDPLTGTTLCLDITTNLFVIDYIDKFCAALKEATTFEACPLTNGMLSVSMTFQKAWVPAPPYGSPEAIEHNKKFQEQQKQKTQK